MLNLPPNPFARDAVKKRERLVGRGEELKTLDYYLTLSASGQGLHLALIGDRGVGKTSLLNAAEQVAIDKGLLPVRLNLDQGKTAFPGRFWFAFYNALILKAFTEGAWGGKQGHVFEAIFKMLFNKEVTSLEDAVLLVPVQYASHKGSQDDYLIEQSLAISDLHALLEELASLGRKGILVLMDEADCLRANPVILQELRNICQSVSGISLCIAGTNQVFPLISDVFSPIPRQFFKVDVKRFTHWSTTYQLISEALPDVDEIQPDLETVKELHQLTAGDPSELKLYCHHIYRALEDGEIAKFELSPPIIRRVLNEFKVGATGPAKQDMELIDGLREEMLNSPAVQMRALTSEQAGTVLLFTLELVSDKALQEADRSRFREEVSETYAELHRMGLSQQTDRLELAGDPLSSAYWKSLARSRSESDFDWQRLPFEYGMALTLFMAYLPMGGLQPGELQSRTANDFTARPIGALRGDGKPGKTERSDVESMLETTLAGRRRKVGSATDVFVKTIHGDVTRWHRLTFLEFESEATIIERLQSHFEKAGAILTRYSFLVEILAAHSWVLPTDAEMHRLGRSARVRVPEEVFGPNATTQGIELYQQGEWEKAIELFEMELADQDTPVLRNDIAFMTLLHGDLDTAEKHLCAALAERRDPLYLHNYALIYALRGDRQTAMTLLQEALTGMDVDLSEHPVDDMVAMLLISPDGKSVYDIKKLPMDAACVVNLTRAGGMDIEVAEKELEVRYPSLYSSLVKSGTRDA